MTSGQAFERRVIQHYLKILDPDYACKALHCCEHPHEWSAQRATEGAWDIIVLGPASLHLVQSKVYGQRGRHLGDSWNCHFRHAKRIGATALVATQDKVRGRVSLYVMDAEKVGRSRRQPWRPVTLLPDGTYA